MDFNSFKKLTASWIFVFFVFACSEGEEKNKFLNYKIRRVSSNVGLLSNTYGDEVRGTNITIHNDSSFVSYINITKSVLYYSNLSESKPYFKTIQLPVDYLNNSIFGNVSSFSFIHDSIIALFQKKRISILNLKSNEIIYERDITVHENTHVVFQDYSIPIHYSSEKNRLYSQIFHDIDESSRAYPFDLEFLGEIDVAKNQVAFIPLKYPESYNKGELGQNSVMKVAFKNDSIVSSSTNEAFISLYDMKKNEITKHLAKSEYHSNLKKLSPDSLWDNDKDDINSLQSFRYDNIFYDQYNKLFYRVFVRPMNLLNEEGLYNTIEDRNKGIVVLDEKLNVLGEIEIPDDNIFWYGVGREGFYYVNSFEIKNDSLFKNYVSILPII